MMKRIAVNRWVYIAVLFAVCVGQSLLLNRDWLLGAVDTFPELVQAVQGYLAFITAGLLMVTQTLTYPLGVVGFLVAFPFLMTGVLTQGEFVVAATWVCAVVGWFQWYVVVPRLFGLRHGVKGQ